MPLMNQIREAYAPDKYVPIKFEIVCFAPDEINSHKGADAKTSLFLAIIVLGFSSLNGNFLPPPHLKWNLPLMNKILDTPLKIGRWVYTSFYINIHLFCKV